MTYLVGERGPELFHAPHNGRIIPHGRSRSIMAGNDNGGRMMGGGASGPAVIIQGATIIIKDARDPAATAREVKRALKQMAGGQAAMLSD